MKKVQIFTLLLATVAGITFADNISNESIGKNPYNTPQPSANHQISDIKTDLTLSLAGDRLVATTITNRSKAPNDDLQIRWTAPKFSGCSSSTFPIKAGPNPQHDVFWAYRTVKHTSGGKTYSCDGTWSVEVINTTRAQVIAEKDYSVNP